MTPEAAINDLVTMLAEQAVAEIVAVGEAKARSASMKMPAPVDEPDAGEDDEINDDHDIKELFTRRARERSRSSARR